MNTLFYICRNITHSKFVCVDGKWSSWTTWTNCSVTCENGTQMRTRTCTNPPPSHGGENCCGNASEIKHCVRELCPDGGWSSWNEWSCCSLVYNCGGFKTRTRTCSNPEPSPYGKYCNGTSIQLNSCVFSDCVNGLGGDCVAIKSAYRNAKSGLYTISLWKSKTKVEVYCDMDTDGGGWMVFQRRFNGSVDFYRTFHEYENGFGQKDGEFCLGLKTIQKMTSNGKSELRIDLTAADGSDAYELFQNFYLSPGRNYTLHIDPGTGIAGDSHGLSYNNGHDFVTKAFDNIYGCAVKDHGGWWYSNCAYVYLNGDYLVPGTTSSVHGGEEGVFIGYDSFKSTVMMFRKLQ